MGKGEGEQGGRGGGSLGMGLESGVEEWGSLIQDVLLLAGLKIKLTEAATDVSQNKTCAIHTVC